MVRLPPRPTAKMSARRPSGSGISSSTEWPAWRIRRQAPRQTAMVMSGRVCRAGASGSMTSTTNRRAEPRWPLVRWPFGLGDELVRQRLGALAVALDQLLGGLFARRLAVGVAAAFGQHQPFVALDRIGGARDAAGQEEAERMLRLDRALRRGAAVPLLRLLGVARHADAGEIGIAELDLR